MSLDQGDPVPPPTMPVDNDAGAEAGVGVGKLIEPTKTKTKASPLAPPVEVCGVTPFVEKGPLERLDGWPFAVS